MSGQFTVKRKVWPSLDKASANPHEDMKDGQFYIGPSGEVRRYSKNDSDTLVIAPKGFPTTQKSKIADTRDKRAELNRMRLLIRMRDLKWGILDSQVEHTDEEIKHLPEAPWASLQKELRDTYDVFHKTYGPLNDFEMRETGQIKDHGEATTYKYFKNLQKFLKDPKAYAVAALEEYDHISGEVTLDPIFTERVARPRQKKFNVSSLKEALGVCLDQKGKVDISYMTALYGATDEEEMLRKLRQQNLVYFDPIDDAWVDAPTYLSGFISDKIDAVQKVINDNPELKRNLEALENVKPDDLEPQDISVSLGMAWIPEDVIEEFACDELEIGEIDATYIPQEHAWYVQSFGDKELADYSEYSTEFVSALRVLKACLNKGLVNVTRTEDRYGHEIDPDFETNVARDKQNQMEEHFRKWLWTDPERAERLKRIYNDRFNALVPIHKLEDDYLSLAGSSLKIELRAHQRKAVWRNIMYGNTLHEQATGSGKTFVAIATAMKLIAQGKVEKPLLNVPNSMVGEFARTFEKFYPHADVLVIEPDEMLEDSAQLTIYEKMQKVMSRIENHKGPVIISHSNYDRFEVSSAFRLQQLLGKAREARSLYERYDFKGMKNRYDKALGEVAAFLGESSHGVMAASELKDFTKDHLDKDSSDAVWTDYLIHIPRDEVLDFGATGIDYVFTDEGHGYKNTNIHSRFEGLSNDGSAKTIKYEEKLDYLRAQRGGFYHTLMTWTPVSNSIAEVYTMQKFLGPDLIKKQGFECFDAWAHQFCNRVESIEIAPEGGFRSVERIAEYQNLPELIRMYLMVADIVTDDMLDLDKPELKGGKEETILIPQYPALTEYLEHLSERAKAVRAGGAFVKNDNLLKIMNDGILATLHPALIDAPYDDDEHTKIDEIADQVAKRYHANKDNVYHNEKGEPDRLKGALQMVLCDLGIAKSGDQFSAYDALKQKLVERGLPASKIQFIHDHTSATKEREIQRKCNEGEVAVIIGTTAKLGTGKNVQKRLIALHQALMLWRPSDDDQGKGRIDRQGNQNQVVEILRYIVENSPDGYRWQTVARKSRFIGQIKSKDLETRDAPESKQTLGYNEVVAAVLNDPLVFETVEISQELSRLNRAKESHKQQVKRARKALPKLRAQIKAEEQAILHLRPVYNAVSEKGHKGSRFTMNGTAFVNEQDAGAALKDRLRAVREDLRSKPKVVVKNLGTLYGYKVHLSAESEVELRPDPKNGEQKSYKYRFVLQVDAPEKFEVSLNVNDIRQIEAERLMMRGEGSNDTATRDVASFNRVVFNKLTAPLQKIVRDVQTVNQAVVRLGQERERLTGVTKQTFALSDDIDRLKERHKQIRKTLKERAKAQNTPIPQLDVF